MKTYVVLPFPERQLGVYVVRANNRWSQWMRHTLQSVRLSGIQFVRLSESQIFQYFRQPRLSGMQQDRKSPQEKFLPI